MKPHIKVSAIQQPCNQERQKNLDLSIELIYQAREEGADLVILPELHLGPYFCQNEDYNNFILAEPIPGPTTAILSQVAKELCIVIVSTIFEKRAPGLYHNTAVVFDQDGSIAGTYRKMHIPNDPGYHEKYYFTPGDTGFKPIETSQGMLGILICWDQWYPEAARLMALAGAELLIYPTAIGWDPSDTKEEHHRQLDAWLTIQRAHAVANGIPVISCNRVGFEASPEEGDSGIQFWGHSFICGQQGEMLVQADATEQKILTCELDHSRSERIRQIWHYLRDRRIDEYGDLVKRFID